MYSNSFIEMLQANVYGVSILHGVDSIPYTVGHSTTYVCTMMQVSMH